MSKFNCPVVTVKTVEKHPNADSLDIITFNEIGWVCIDKLGIRKVNDKVIYIPIDSLVPVKHEEFKFLESQANSLGFARIRTLRLRNIVSQGLIINIPENQNNLDDYKDYFGIVKYEPLPEDLLQTDGGYSLPGWLTKADAERYQNIVNELELYRNLNWYCSLKIDGTSSNFAIDFNETTNKYIIGGHRLAYKTENFYSLINKKYDLLKKVELIGIELNASQISLQGEICGPKIQKNRMGLSEIQFFAFDIFLVKEGFSEYIDYNLFLSLCKKYNIPTVEILSIGKLPNLEDGLKYVNNLKYSNSYPAEGVVYVADPNFQIYGVGRAKTKILSQEYDLKNK